MIDNKYLKYLYINKHLSTIAISRIVCLSGRQIARRLNSIGVDVSKKGIFKVKCEVCGEKYLITRHKYTLETKGKNSINAQYA